MVERRRRATERRAFHGAGRAPAAVAGAAGLTRGRRSGCAGLPRKRELADAQAFSVGRKSVVSGQGSSSSDAAVRVEVYLDGRPEAVQVLTAPPFRFKLDTAALEEGDHTLRLVRVDAAGRRRERTIPFTVERGPGLEVRGLEPGATVTGRVDIDVVTPAGRPPRGVRARVCRGPGTGSRDLALRARHRAHPRRHLGVLHARAHLQQPGAGAERGVGRRPGRRTAGRSGPAEVRGAALHLGLRELPQAER